MIAWARSDSALTMGHGQIEDRVMSDGMELMRVLTEAHVALRTAHRMLSLDPAWEEAIIIAVEVHLREGRPTLARQAYDQGVRALREDLGVDPSPALRSLATRLQQT